MAMNLSKLWEMVKDREAWHATVHGITKSWTRLSNNQSRYNISKHGDNIQPWCTPFPILNQSIGPCLVQMVASWPAYRFLRRQVRWPGIPMSLKNFPTVILWFMQAKALAQSLKQFIKYLPLTFQLTSLCIIGSRLIHLIRTDSNAFLFIAE